MKNPVARHARTFNKSAVYKDRKKLAKAGYQKHKRPVQHGPCRLYKICGSGLMGIQ